MRELHKLDDMNQINRITLLHTYSGTVRSETVRLLFSILAETDYEFQSADVRTAFLYGEVPANQDIYMSRPTGLTDDQRKM